MVETKIDPVAAFLPMETRPAPPAVAFAPYLEQAWSFTAATPPSPALHSTMDSSSQHSSAPVGPLYDDSSFPEAHRDNHRNDRTQGAPPVEEAETHSTTNDAVSSPADTVGEGDRTPAASHEDGSGQEDTTDGTEDRADAPEEAHSETEPDTDLPVNEHEAAQAAVSADAAVGQATDSDIQGDRTPASGTTAELSQSQAEQEASPQGKAPSETSSAETAVSSVDKDAPSDKSESGVDGGGSSELLETMDGNRDESGSHQDSEEPLTSNERGARQRKQRTAQEVAPARVARAADSHQPLVSESADQAAIAAASNVATALNATDAIAAPIDTDHPATVTATNVSTTPSEHAEPAATVAARPDAPEAGSRAGVTTSGAPETDQAGAVDRARFVQRVARAFQSMGDRGGTVRLRLSPPELGSLRIEITVNRGVMDARLEAETEAARQLLLDNLPMLRARLAGQDIKIEQFQVDLSDRQPGGPPGWSDGRPEWDQTSAGQRREPVDHTSDSEEDGTVGHTRAHHTGQPSQFDIFV